MVVVAVVVVGGGVVVVVFLSFLLCYCSAVAPKTKQPFGVRS